MHNQKQNLNNNFENKNKLVEKQFTVHWLQQQLTLLQR